MGVLSSSNKGTIRISSQGSWGHDAPRVPPHRVMRPDCYNPTTVATTLQRLLQPYNGCYNPITAATTLQRLLQPYNPKMQMPLQSRLSGHVSGHVTSLSLHVLRLRGGAWRAAGCAVSPRPGCPSPPPKFKAQVKMVQSQHTTPHCRCCRCPRAQTATASSPAPSPQVR